MYVTTGVAFRHQGSGIQFICFVLIQRFKTFSSDQSALNSCTYVIAHEIITNNESNYAQRFVNSENISVLNVSCPLDIKTECLKYPLATEAHDQSLLRNDTIALSMKPLHGGSAAGASPTYAATLYCPVGAYPDRPFGHQSRYTQRLAIRCLYFIEEVG